MISDGSVDLTPMSDLDDHDDQFLIADLVDDPVDSLPDSVTFLP
jgi:hypothetical protein